MRAKRVSFDNVRSATILMDGGINENSSSLELKGGELIFCRNYELYEGTQSGYVSTKGYERFDGQTAPSSIPATSAEDETDRELARTEILEVPGEGNVLGVHVFEGDVYAFRNKEGGLTAGMYKNTTAGWEEIDTTTNPLLPDGDYSFVNYNFYATVATSAMLWTDRINKAMYYDGTTVVPIVKTEASPPINLIVHAERLFLAYPDGILEYSNVGDPLDWTTLSGEFGVGNEITNLVYSVGNTFIIYCVQAIKVFKGTTEETFVIETFSTVSGAYQKSAKRLLGDIFTMDDRGVVSFAAVQEFGDFGNKRLSEKIQRTLEANKLNVTCAVVSRDKNQYRLYLNNGLGLYFSFLNKKLRGITIIEFPIPVLSATTGRDNSGDTQIYFTSSNGFVYHMESGTSFDGAAIETVLKTAFYHYGIPRLWKRFKALVIEAESKDSLDVSFRASFDYNDTSLTPKGTSLQLLLKGAGALWGAGVWGTMTWGASSVTNRFIQHIKGLGSNLSLEFRTSSKYNRTHTIQNVTTDYEISGRQL